jgi:hypothetical protein
MPTKTAQTGQTSFTSSANAATGCDTRGGYVKQAGRDRQDGRQDRTVQYDQQFEPNISSSGPKVYVLAIWEPPDRGMANHRMRAEASPITRGTRIDRYI